MDNNEERSFRHINYWLDLCDDELKIAHLLLKNKHYLYCGFFCHQITEKALKAYCCYVNKEEKIPAKTHSLHILIENAGLKNELSSEQWEFIVSVDPLNIEARYPEYKRSIYLQVSVSGVCGQLFSQTEEFLLWIKNRLSK